MSDSITENSRRKFVKNSALVTSGFAVMPSILTAGNSVSANDKIKLAVIGCGGRGSGAVVQAMHADDGIQLVAMADAFEDRLESCLENVSKIFDAERINVKDKTKFVGFGSYRKAIDMADVVILATPPGFRPQHFDYAVQQGKHVFMEKPLATDPAGVRQILAVNKVAKEKNLNVVVGLQRHYQTNYRKTFEMVKSGEIGKIISGQVYWNSSGVWVRERQPSQTEIEYQMRNWYYFNWLCGDHILEQHIHNIDVANWFIGETPLTAQGMGGREVRNGKEHGQIFDHHFVEFTYPSGAVISSQCRHQPGCMNRVSEKLQGTKGSVSADGGGIALVKNLDGNEMYKHNGEDDPNPYQVEHDELFASIRKGGVINNVQYGAESTMTAIMGRMATYSGEEILWDQAFNLDGNIVPNEMELSWDSPAPVVPLENGFYPVPVPGVTKF